MIHDMDELDDVNDVKEMSTVVEGVSGVIFTIMKWCMVRLVTVVHDIDFVILAAWQFGTIQHGFYLYSGPQQYSQLSLPSAYLQNHLGHPASASKPAKSPTHQSPLFTLEVGFLMCKPDEYFNSLINDNHIKTGQPLRCLKTLGTEDTVFRTIKNA